MGEDFEPTITLSHVDGRTGSLFVGVLKSAVNDMLAQFGPFRSRWFMFDEEGSTEGLTVSRLGDTASIVDAEGDMYTIMLDDVEEVQF